MTKRLLNIETKYLQKATGFGNFTKANRKKGGRRWRRLQRRDKNHGRRRAVAAKSWGCWAQGKKRRQLEKKTNNYCEDRRERLVQADARTGKKSSGGEKAKKQAWNNKSIACIELYRGGRGGGRLWKQFNGEIERLAASSPLKLFCTTAFWPIRPVGDQQLKVVKKKTVKKVFLPTTHEFSDHRHRSWRNSDAHRREQYVAQQILLLHTSEKAPFGMDTHPAGAEVTRGPKTAPMILERSGKVVQV